MPQADSRGATGETRAPARLERLHAIARQGRAGLRATELADDPERLFAKKGAG